MGTALIDLPAPAHIEAAHAAAAQKNDAISKKIDSLNERIVDARAQIATLTENYNRACRDLAEGKSADPSAIAAQIDLVRMRLSGLEQFHLEATAEAEPIVAEHAQTFRALRAAKESAREAQLTAVVENRRGAFDKARENLDIAHRNLNIAAGELEAFQRQLELAHERRRKGQEL